MKSFRDHAVLQGKNRGLETRWVEGRVTVSKGCHNKVPEAGWLKATETSFSHSGAQASEVKVLVQPCSLLFSRGDSPGLIPTSADG